MNFGLLFQTSPTRFKLRIFIGEHARFKGDLQYK